MASKFKELFLNTYEVKGTLNGAEVHATVKTKNVFDAVALLEKEVAPGSQWASVHRIKKTGDTFSLGWLVISIIVLSVSLSSLVTAEGSSWSVVLQVLCGYFLASRIIISCQAVYKKLRKSSQSVE